MLRKISICFVIFAFFLTLPGPLPQSHAQGLELPVPGTMVDLSPSFVPAILMGIKVHPENPLEFDFLVNPGQKPSTGAVRQEEYLKLAKYFLAALTTPEKDLWVNLSPYEKNRVLPNDFAQTEVGRDLLAEDYMLKQLSASLIYPEKELGRKFWDKVYLKAQKELGTTQIPVNTFNKVWIVPQKAVVYENGSTAMILESHLKVMLEEDYLSMKKHRVDGAHTIASQAIREIILPEIEREVNEGEHFAALRQIYHAVILSAWYKARLKESILGQIYVDKAKTRGIALRDPSENEKIFQRYIKAYKKGVFNFIKEEPFLGTNIPRKYFSGGVNLLKVTPAMTSVLPAQWRSWYQTTPMDSMSIDLSPASHAMLTDQELDDLLKFPSLYSGAIKNLLRPYKEDPVVAREAVLFLLDYCFSRTLPQEFKDILFSQIAQIISKATWGIGAWKEDPAKQAQIVQRLLIVHVRTYRHQPLSAEDAGGEVLNALRYPLPEKEIDEPNSAYARSLIEALRDISLLQDNGPKVNEALDYMMERLEKRYLGNQKLVLIKYGSAQPIKSKRWPTVILITLTAMIIVGAILNSPGVSNFNTQKDDFQDEQKKTTQPLEARHIQVDILKLIMELKPVIFAYHNPKLSSQFEKLSSQFQKHLDAEEDLQAIRLFTNGRALITPDDSLLDGARMLSALKDLNQALQLLKDMQEEPAEAALKATALGLKLRTEEKYGRLPALIEGGQRFVVHDLQQYAQLFNQDVSTGSRDCLDLFLNYFDHLFSAPETAPFAAAQLDALRKIVGTHQIDGKAFKQLWDDTTNLLHAYGDNYQAVRGLASVFDDAPIQVKSAIANWREVAQEMKGHEVVPNAYIEGAAMEIFDLQFFRALRKQTYLVDTNLRQHEIIEGVSHDQNVRGILEKTDQIRKKIEQAAGLDLGGQLNTRYKLVYVYIQLYAEALKKASQNNDFDASRVYLKAYLGFLRATLGQEGMEHLPQGILAQLNAWTSPAMLAETLTQELNNLSIKGGIDLNEQLGTIEYQGQAAHIPVPKGFEWLLQEPVSGFTPRIKSIHTGTWNTLPFFAEIRTRS